MTKFENDTAAVKDGVIGHKLHEAAPVDEQVPAGHNVAFKELKGQYEPAGQMTGAPVLQ